MDPGTYNGIKEKYRCLPPFCSVWLLFGTEKSRQQAGFFCGFHWQKQCPASDRALLFLLITPARSRSFLPLLPIMKLWQLHFKISPRLLRRPVFIGHMPNEKIRQLLQIAVHKLPAGLAPFPILLIERTVRFPAGRGIIQEHTAALADQLPGRAQKGIDGHVKQP